MSYDEPKNMPSSWATEESKEQGVMNDLNELSRSFQLNYLKKSVSL